MDTRSAVLQLLEENKSTALSGQQIADRLGVTRAAVWKAVKSLREDGYSITATTNKGYMLTGTSDVVSVEGIRAALPDRYKNLPLEVKQSTVSTNIDVGAAAASGAPHGTTVVALEQKSGQGRLGKSFCSPKGGLYFSTLIRPTLSIDKAVMITPAAAVAAHKAITDILGLPVSIKWVNDIYMNGRKVVGISTQAQADIAVGGISGIIVGTGINYNTAQSDFSGDIQNKAGSLYYGDAPAKRNELIAAAITTLLDLSKDLTDKSYMDYYRKHCFVLGARVDYEIDREAKSGIVEELDDNGALIIAEDGRKEKRHLSCGEISVRPRS